VYLVIKFRVLTSDEVVLRCTLSVDLLFVITLLWSGAICT